MIQAAISEPETGIDNRSSVKGLVSNIQRFNIHDGDGIRTLVFLKGCPLRCLWCANPEGQKPTPELQVFADRCVQCGSCKTECVEDAVKYGPDQIPVIDRRRCNACGACAESCPSGTLAVVGQYLTVEEVMNEVRKDAAYYWRSGGGITITGGEPCVQDEFVANLLKAANDIFIHTAVETCGYVRWTQMEKLLPYTDTFLYDIKHMDSVVHQELTGRPNELILENARGIAGYSDTELVFRTPIIPGKNDDMENLIAIAAYAAQLNAKQWDLLPYHRFGEAKYEQMGRDYVLGSTEPPDRKRMREIKASVKDIFQRVEIDVE